MPVSKKIHYEKKDFLFFFISFSLFLLSCEDALDIVQDGELNDEALFTSVQNMQFFLNETYDQLTIQNEIMLSSTLTDEVAVGSAGFPSETLSFNVFSTNGFAINIWSSNYRAINYANRLIRGSQLFTPPTTDLPAYNNIIAQARAIRAFCHFNLLTYFSTNLADPNAPGVMLVDFVPTTAQKIPRSTNAQVFSLIESDLLFAENNLTTPTSGGNSWRFFNVNVINAMRARMYLYRGLHTQAETYADLVINNSGIQLASCTFTLPTDFPLTSNSTTHIGASGSDSFDTQPPAGPQRALFLMDRWTATAFSPDYRKMWVDFSQGEAIFSLLRLNNNANFGSQYNTNQSYIGGGPLRDMGRNLYELFTQPMGGGAQDFRRWSFVDRSSLIVPDATQGDQFNDVLIVDKYPGKAGNHGSNDLKVFRMSEMYFIKAECRIAAGDTPGAAALIRTVRQNRNYIASAVVPLPTYANPTAAWADVLLERRKELCFEGHRYIDLKRIGTLAGVTTTDRFLTDSQNSSAINPLNISVTDFRLTLPIPQDEINVNPMAQNPGY
ncbi:MAG: RagB/SusD family nutrient uptake outer membrane protein [Flavobacterium sp.]|nr:RagB/SusD family nutrient uptake outer membrane protein [Flavobacterium sp.]